jgi:preprotein translocase subunit SecA
MMGILNRIKTIFDPNQWEINKLQKHLDAVNGFEKDMEGLSDAQLKGKTAHFKEKLAGGAALEEVLPEAFAVCREVSRRTVGMRPYDVQILGALVLHQGRIAEMKTGEGKTLVATMPTYLNALAGKGVHLVTVNDYLAKRDARWMGPIYHYLGMSVGVIQHDQAFIYDPDYIVGDDRQDQLREVPRRDAYQADITYGTNNEFGFDYLRDNLVMELEDRVQRELHYAIVDEVDSILIDEARTPLIISGHGGHSSDNYRKFARVANRMVKDTDYTVDEKAHSTPLTEAGVETVEKYLGLTAGEEDEEHPLYSNENIELVHHLDCALKAKELYRRDVDYVIKEGEIIIVDEFTGRLMFGRRYSDGLHQAIEAKENVKVRSEDQTLASITFQNYFRMYSKLSGMTGTALTEEKEFKEIYRVDVVVIPTNKPVVRINMNDRIYKNEETKFFAVINEIEEMNRQGRPVLVGTRSIEKSEWLSSLLKKKSIRHNVLNAKHHEKEAQIIAEAGLPAAVTIATNMAGRGVDIILGGTQPSAERERRAHKSARAHCDKISRELDELKAKLEENKSEIARVEASFEQTQKELQDAKGELKKSKAEEILSLHDGRKEALDSIHGRLQELRAASDDLARAVKGHQDMLPDLQEKVEKTGAELKAREQEMQQEMRDWAVNHDAVVKAGGLAIIGTERHESRRIDNQLRGRSGRQGDPGSSRFYTALEDELMRLFGSQQLPEWLTNWEDDPDTPLEFGIFTRSIQSAQARVESFHFDIRKSILEYDNVMNEQRKIIYAERDKILRGEDLKPHMLDFLDKFVANLVDLYAPDHIPFEEWDLDSLLKSCRETFSPLPLDAAVSDLEITDRAALREKVMEWASGAYQRKEQKLGADLMRTLERWTLLQMVDSKWIDHLQTMEDLKEGVRLRAYGQKDPLVEFINESYEYFEAMKQSLQEETIRYLMRVQVKSEGLADQYVQKVKVTREHRGDGEGENYQKIREGPKVGRNDPCPCGSGKKFKKCCGRNA